MDYSKQWNWAFLVMVIFALVFGVTALVRDGMTKEPPIVKENVATTSQTNEDESVEELVKNNKKDLLGNARGGVA